MGSYMKDQPNMGNNGGSSSSNNNNNSNSSSKKGKNKSGGSNSDKPKQPQRGLGVAQLEKIRLHGQLASCGYLPHHLPHHGPFPNPPYQEDMRIQAGYHAAALQSSASPFAYPSPPVGSSSPYGYHPSFMVGTGDPMERTNSIRYTESHPCTTARWNPNNNVMRIPESQQYAQTPGMVTRHLLSHVEQNSTSNNIFESMGSSSSQISEPNEKEELDLELRL